MKKAKSDLKKSSKKDVKKLNDKVETLKEEKREMEEIIDKMEEEKKTMQAEIENCEKFVSFSNDYIVSFKKLFILSLFLYHLNFYFCNIKYYQKYYFI